MLSIILKFREWLGRGWTSFSFVGLAVATLFFAASLSPSLLPRPFVVQGILSGFALAVGYGVGVFFVWLWLYLEIPQPQEKLQSLSKCVTTTVVAVVVAVFLWRATIWQNSIRELMGMEPVATAYPWRVALIALVTGLVLIAIARAIGMLWRFVHRKITAVVPRRISYVVSTLVVLVGLVLIVNDVFARLLLNAADGVFLQLDQAVDDGVEQPTRSTASGSEESLIDWDDVGRRGKNFIVGGPTQESISEFWGEEAEQPLRVYAGMGAEESVEERAKLALEELKRVGGFDRSVLIVATPTGTGWLDPGGVDTVEYLHKGDSTLR